MATANTGPVQAQPTTVTYNVPSNPDERPCMQRFAPCSFFVGLIGIMLTFSGIVNLAVGANIGRGLSESFYEAFPEERNSGRNQVIAGVFLLIIGICVLSFSIYWCRYVKRNFPTQSMFSRTQMTSGVVVASSSGVVQPPNIQGVPGQQTYVYSYQASQQAGTVQQVQPGMNPYQPGQPVVNQYPPGQPGQAQYPPAQPGMAPYQPGQPVVNQYPPVQPGQAQYPPAQSVIQPSAPGEPIPNQPPPTYNELMEPTKAPDTVKSYGDV